LEGFLGAFTPNGGSWLPKVLTAHNQAVIILSYKERDHMIQELNDELKAIEEKLKELRGYL